MLDAQNPDGGIPFITGFEIFCTATGGLAPLAHVPGQTSTDDVLIAMGDDLAARQQPDGGWGYAEHVRQTDVDDTAYCLQFLRALRPHHYHVAISAGEEYLLRIANPDGGFPTFRLGV